MKQVDPVFYQKIQQNLPAGWDSVTALLYQCYDGQGEKNPNIQQYFQLLAKYTDSLPFEVQDQICMATVALCVEHARAAFSEGIAVGAKLMMEWMEV